MKTKYLKKSLIISIILAVVIITTAVLLHFLNPDDIKPPITSLNSAEDIYDLNVQNEIWGKIENIKSSSNFTFKNPLVIQNPFQTNNQSLYLYFETETPSSLKYTIHVADENIPDFAQTCYNGNESNMTVKHEYQLIGLIPDYNNEVTLDLTYSNGQTETKKFTYKAPSLLGSGKVILSMEDGESMESLTDGLYTVFAGDNFFYYYDNNGILRSEIPIIDYRCLRLIFHNDKMYYSAGKSTFVEMNNLGRLTSIFDLDQYDVHHDYTFYDEENILLLGTDTTSDRVEDRILSLNTKTGAVTQVLDLTDIFPDYYNTCTPDKEGELDWMHINTIQWLGNGSVLLSSRETSSILKINNLFTNKPNLEYMLGTNTFWKNTGYSSYLYEKKEDFKSQLGQHSITYVPDSTLEKGQYYLYLFDNNIGASTTRPDYKWTKYFDNIGTAGAAQNDETSFFYKYLVDENSKTYDLIESFPVPYSGYMSSVQEIGANVVINSSNAKVFEEYDKDNILIRSFQTGSEKQAYRTYKYTFDNFYFFNNN